MRLWQTRFETARPFASLPRVLSVTRERQNSSKYHFYGRYRQAEMHCLFKYTLSGEGRFLDADGEHSVPAGHGFLCEIYDPATEYYYPAEGRAVWEFIHICFLGETGISIAKELIRRHGPVYRLEPDSPIIRRLLGVRKLDDAEMDICPGDGAALVFELLAALESSKHVCDMHDAGSELARRAKRLMEESMPKGMPVGELAQALEVSREHLARAFVHETASTPHEYMTRLRLRHACRLLKESSLDIKGVGDALGIDVPQHFTRLFKKSMKMTPTQFRRHGLVPEF